MTMELPECHNAAIEKAAAAMCESESPCPSCRAAARDAITAYLSALKDQGLMREAHQYPYARGEFWEATTLLEDHNALIIRTESEQ